MAGFFPRSEVAGTQLVMSRLGRKWGAPPFSVLDARSGWWIKRKRQWRGLGVNGGAGKGLLEQSGTFLAADIMRQQMYSKHPVEVQEGFGTSFFDPVLVELLLRWFCPVGGVVLDPFAGGAVLGIVASVLNHNYVGVEIRDEQVEANRKQAESVGVQPKWILGDSTKIDVLLPDDLRADFVLTSPPYYDLEVYSDRVGDGSSKQTYQEFLLWYRNVFQKIVSVLRKNRFLIVQVGEIRDKKTGVYRNFVGDTISVLTQLGLSYWNEFILVTSGGSLPVRVGRYFTASRKAGKTHQNILCFWKGDPKNIRKVFHSGRDKD
jgi:DNA modification methylase